MAISDLVKNRLYSEAKDQVDRAQQLWEKMEIELSRRPIPEYLRHFWIAKKIDEKTGTVREKQLYRMIAKDVKGKRAGTIKLLEDLSLSATDYARINDYSLWPDDDAYDTSLEGEAPIGPIVISYAFPFNDRPGDRTEDLQFSFGTTF